MAEGPERSGDGTGEHPALAACLKGKLQELQRLNPGPGGWPGLKDDRGATAVHYAARSGSVDAIRWLVEERGCRGNSRSRVGATPALDAAATGKQEALTWLLERGGCKFSDEDSSGASALHLAARYGHLATVKWLETTLEADLSMTTKAGATPLHFAASRGDLDIVKFLVERNPSVVDRQMETGVTSSYLAAQEGHLEVLRYLVEEGGAKLSVTSFDGMSCLHAAAQMGRLDCVAWMVVTGKIGINECDFDGASALHFAAGRGHLRVVEWLLVSGARIIQDNIGGSPLHDAAEHGQVKCVRALVQFGCDAGLKDNNGMTAADLAENCWHRDCAATIRRRLAKGVSGTLVNAKKRPSIQNYFHNGDYVDMSGLLRRTDHEGTTGSDYVDADSGSETSSTYVVHTDFSRSSGRSSDGEYYNQYIARFHGNGFPRFSIPPPPSWPPPPVPNGSVTSGNGENADVTSSTTSSQSEAEGYENLNAAELASLMHMRNAIQHGGGVWNTGGGAWNGGMPIYGMGALTGHEPKNGEDGIYGNATQVNGFGPAYPGHAHPIYGTSIPITRHRPMGRGQGEGRSSPSHGGLGARSSLGRYNATSPVSHDVESGGFSRVTMSPRLKEILERDSEVGSRQASLDALESSTNGSSPSNVTPPTELSINEEATPPDASGGRSTVSAPTTPAHPPPPPPPPAPPPLPDTYTPPTNSLRWKKMAFGSLPNVSMAGAAAKFLLRPNVNKNSSGSKSPNIDLIAELKAANGRQSLKRMKRQQDAADDTASVISTTDDDTEKEPKSFWKQLQKRPSPPHSDAGSRRSSIALRPEFDPKNFLDKVTETDVLGNTIPAWKKQILARQMAEKAQAAADEQKKVEEEQNKYKDLPAWKRALVEKKEKLAKEKQEAQDNEKQNETQNIENSKKQVTAPATQEESIKSESKLILKKTHNKFEELDNKMSEVKPMMAPWQVELKKKKQSLKEGFV